MATLHLMVGLPCSGKTTYATALAKTSDALRLTPDAWQIRLFGDNVYAENHDFIHTTVEELMWEVAERVLQLGTSVILDFGFWAKEEREDFRARAAKLGVGFCIHYMNVPKEELFARLEKRNAALPTGCFPIPVAFMESYLALFTPPTAQELATALPPAEHAPQQ